MGEELASLDEIIELLEDVEPGRRRYVDVLGIEELFYSFPVNDDAVGLAWKDIIGEATYDVYEKDGDAGIEGVMESFRRASSASHLPRRGERFDVAGVHIFENYLVREGGIPFDDGTYAVANHLGEVMFSCLIGESVIPRGNVLVISPELIEKNPVVRHAMTVLEQHCHKLFDCREHLEYKMDTTRSSDPCFARIKHSSQEPFPIALLWALDRAGLAPKTVRKDLERLFGREELTGDDGTSFAIGLARAFKDDDWMDGCPFTPYDVKNALAHLGLQDKLAERCLGIVLTSDTEQNGLIQDYAHRLGSQKRLMLEYLHEHPEARDAIVVPSSEQDMVSMLRELWNGEMEQRLLDEIAELEQMKEQRRRREALIEESKRRKAQAHGNEKKPPAKAGKNKSANLTWNIPK